MYSLVNTIQCKLTYILSNKFRDWQIVRVFFFIFRKVIGSIVVCYDAELYSRTAI